MTKRIGSRRIGGEVQAVVMTFLVDHPNVRPSPYAATRCSCAARTGRRMCRRAPAAEIGIHGCTRISLRRTRLTPSAGERKFGMLLPPNRRRMPIAAKLRLH